ncbi:MAG: hypothetical protein WA001_04760 [Patescibacteria group bacterium]
MHVIQKYEDNVDRLKIGDETIVGPFPTKDAAVDYLVKCGFHPEDHNPEDGPLNLEKYSLEQPWTDSANEYGTSKAIIYEVNAP